MNRLLLALPFLLALALTACVNDSQATNQPPLPPTSVAQPRTPATAAALNSNPATTAQLPDGTGALPGLRLERAFAGVSFQRMTGMYPAPDQGARLYVTEQAGRIMTFDSAAPSPQAGAFLDISDRVDANSSEMGLLGLAFAPDFAETGIFYVDYTAGNPRRTVVSRFKADETRTSANPAGEEVLLTIDQPFANHNGGQLAFGPDGYLYIGMGDGGSGNDPMGNGQNRRVLLGKLLRIDVRAANGDAKYRVPSDNPFASDNGARPEIWAYGLRNPWRFSFDTQTGALWLADVGQNTREEIDVIEKGGNYGWRVMEGSQCLGGGSSCNREGLQLPVFDYANGGGNCSITGGYIYRGETIPTLRGAYVYGDYCSGRIWALRYDGSRMTNQGELLDADIQISSFAQDAAGEIYALQYAGSGGIFRLIP